MALPNRLNRMGIIQYAILNDIHFPYESKAYYTAIGQMREWPDLRAIFLNGDIAEIESVKTHPRNPGEETLLMNELAYVNQKFDTLQGLFPDIPVHYISGNHEYRIFRFIQNMCPALWGMLHEPKLFQFDKRPKWMFHNYGPTQLVKVGRTTDLYVRHEPLAGGMAHAKGTAEKSAVSLIYGHTHVFQMYTHKKFGPLPIVNTAMSNGFLGDIKAKCFDYRGAKDNWINGFTRVDCDEKSGAYEFKFIPL